MSRNPLDRSAAFTCLLELDRGGFGKSGADETRETITAFLGNFYESGQTHMYEYAQQWLSERQEGAQPQERAPERQPDPDMARLDPPATMNYPGTVLRDIWGPGMARERAPEAESGDRENPYQPFTPEHRVWEIAQSTPDLSDEAIVDARRVGSA